MAVQREKKKYQQQLKDLEVEHFEQGRTIDQAVTTDNFQTKVKYLMEDLRMWRDKNAKLEAAYQKEKETRENQKIKMAQIEEETNKYKSQL